MENEMIWWMVAAIIVEAVVGFFVMAWVRRIKLPTEKRTMYTLMLVGFGLAIAAVILLIGKMSGAFDPNQPPHAEVPMQEAIIEPAGARPEIEVKVNAGSMDDETKKHQDNLKRFEGSK